MVVVLLAAQNSLIGRAQMPAPSPRHSRVGGNPRLRHLRAWIPAYAGMTEIRCIFFWNWTYCLGRNMVAAMLLKMMVAMPSQLLSESSS